MAGAGRRTFTPGEVLTASNVMNYLQDQAVMNFAGTAARGSAIGTAVSEGMVSYLADTNVVQAYDGSAWNSLAYATAVPTNAQNGMKPVIPTGVTVSSGSGSYDSTTGLVTFSSAVNLNVAGIFTSTYKYYKIILAHKTVGGTSEVAAWFTNAGTSITTGWYGAGFYTQYAGATGNANARSNGNGGWISYASPSFYSEAIVDAYVEQSLNTPLYQGLTYLRASGNQIFYGYGTDGACDGFRISPLTGGISLTGTMKVYGYN